MAVCELNDNWGDLKEYGPAGNVYDIGIISAPYDGIISTPYAIISDGFVGKEDPVDYMAFTLENTAKLS